MRRRITLQQQFMALQEMLSVSERKSDILTNLLKEASTEFERTLEQVSVSETNFRAVFENAPEAIIIFDQDTHQILDCNPFAIAWLEYSRPELLSRRYDEIIIPGDLPLENSIRTINSQGLVKIWDRRFQKKDGTQVDAEVTGTPITYQGKSAIVALARDITDRKKAEEALRESEQRFRDIALHLPDWIWEADQNWTYTYSSSGVEKILGYRPYEVVGTPIWDGMPEEEDITTLEKIIAEIKEHPTAPRLYESRRRHRNGTLVYLESSVVPRFDNSNNLVGLRGIHRDVTARIQLQELSRYKELFENVTDPVFILDFRGRFLEVNDISIKLFGYSRYELQNLRIGDLAKPGQVEILFETGKKIQGGQTLQFELEMVNRSGDIFPFEFHARPIVYKGQDAVLSVGRDLSMRKKLEKTLIATERVAALGEMASGIAHNFNNVLQLIAAAADAAAAKLAAGRMRDGFEAIRRIQDASQRAAEIVRRIKDYTQSDREGLNETFDLKNLIQEAVELTQPLWKNLPDSRKYEVRVTSSGHSLVRGRPTEIYEVVINLIKNALEAMPEGGILTLAITEEQNKVHLKVSDTGHGVSDKNLTRIFEPFFTTKGLQSSGLGLASSYGIIKKHQGEIKVASLLGFGTTFTVILPRAEEPTYTGLAPKSPDILTKIRFLMIDDEINVLKAMEMFFDGTDVEIVTSPSAAEGLEMYRAGSFDVVLCDLGMDDMDGWEVGKQIKQFCLQKKRQKTPFLIYTGWNKQFSQQKLEDSGVDRMVLKPVSCEDLLRILRESAESGEHAQDSLGSLSFQR
jgi:PAS domain S-box-containing protein